MPKERTKAARYWASELWELQFLCHKRQAKAWMKRRLSKARRRGKMTTGQEGGPYGAEG